MNELEKEKKETTNKDDYVFLDEEIAGLEQAIDIIGMG